MAKLTPAPTMYFDLEGGPPSVNQTMMREGNVLLAKDTVYHDAQVLPYSESTMVAPAPEEPKGIQCCGFICCLRAPRTSERPMSPVVDLRQSGPLTSIKEASLTKEQMLRKQTETSKIGRKPTEFQSMDNSTSEELQEVLTQFQAKKLADEQADGSVLRKLSRKFTSTKDVNQVAEEKKAGQSESVMRKLSRKFTASRDLTNRDDTAPEGKPSGLSRNLTRMLTRKLTETVALTEPLGVVDFEHLKKFHGNWDGVHERNRPGNSELSRVMALGWALRKALDNMPGISIQIEENLLKNQAKVFGLVDIREERPWSGEKIKMKRKDLRGMATTWVQKLDDGFVVHSEWPDPYAAKSTEEYHLVDDNNSMVMAVKVVRTTGESCEFKYHFTRSTK